MPTRNYWPKMSAGKVNILVWFSCGDSCVKEFYFYQKLIMHGLVSDNTNYSYFFEWMSSLCHSSNVVGTCDRQ